MPDPERLAGSDDAQRGRFATTQWSIVVAAGRQGSAQSRQALARLCEVYWMPLYAYVRRSGYSAPDAQDVIQEFFALLLEKHYLGVADRERGKFRAFLLTALKHFLSHEREKAAAQKRGGRRALLSLDFQTAEGRLSLEPADETTPERVYARRWAVALLDLVLARLREEWSAAGKGELFDRLKPYLAGEEGLPTYLELAEQLDRTEGAIKVAVHRLRRRYRELLKDEIAQTVATPEEAQDELRQLFASLAS